MNKIILFVFAFFILIFSSCIKQTTTSTSAEIVKDCTGVYLRFNGLDNPVCNRNILSNYENGTIIFFTYRNAKQGTCEGISCMMVHSGLPIGKVIKVIRIE